MATQTIDKKMQNIYSMFADCESAEERGHLLARILGFVFNDYSYTTVSKVCAEDIIKNSHNTIQQSIMQGAIHYIEEMNDNPCIDIRNEDAKKAAEAMYNVLSEKDLLRLRLF